MTTQGFTTEKFAPVREVLEQQLVSGADVGASVSVRHRGETVVDIWGGFTDAECTRPWEADTITNVWSTTKTMTFLVALMLADRGEPPSRLESTLVVLAMSSWRRRPPPARSRRAAR